MPIKFRRGLNADRTSITPESGEPIWTTDTKKLYMGDGSTAGGILVAGAGDVTGPSSSVNNNVVLFSGTTGKVIKDSGLTLSGTNTGDQTVSVSSPLTGGGSGHIISIGISQATTSSSGYLSQTDWNTFNNKQSAITTGTTSQYFRGDLSLATFPTLGTWSTLNYPSWTSGTPFVKMTAAGTFSLDSATYLTGNQSISFSPTGDVSSTGGSGSTSLTPAITVTGIKGASVPTLSTGFLKYNGTSWVFDNSTYLTTAVTSISFGSTGLTPSTSSTGSVTVSGTLNVSNGGTGVTSLTGIVIGNGTSPMSSVGITGSSLIKILKTDATGSSYSFIDFSSLPPFNASDQGLVPRASSGTSPYLFLASDGTWQKIPLSGPTSGTPGSPVVDCGSRI